MKMTSHFKHKQVGGDHYERLEIQPIEFCLGNNLGPCESNIVKYITWLKKDPINDLRKARQYAQSHWRWKQTCQARFVTRTIPWRTN